MSAMPPSASLTLPPVTMSGEYIMEEHESHSDQGWAPDDFPAKPGNYLQGNYLRCVAEVRGRFVDSWPQSWMNRSASIALDSLERVVSSVQIGSFEHNLTTDLLNHLVFLQKVFMKEVNEVIQKVSGDGPHTFTKFSSDCRLHLQP